MIIHQTQVKSMKIFKIAISASLILSINSCCPTNYSANIKEILEPTKERVSKFIKEQQRYPTHDEIGDIIEEVGCQVVELQSGICIYKGDRYIYSNGTEITDGVNWLVVSLDRGESGCGFTINENGKIESQRCNNGSYIKIDP